jgi:hypothetical protein
MGARSAAVALGTAALALAWLGLTACTESTGGTAEPGTNPPIATPAAGMTSTATETPSTPAPPVARPLNATGIVQAPCSALTNDDVAGLNITYPQNEAVHDTVGTQCTWAGESGGVVSIGWETTNTHGLTDMYAQRPTFAYWQPTTVSGYPGVYGDAIGDGRPQGNCVLSVGVSNHLYFISEFTIPLNPTQSCPLATRAATDVIKNLSGGA